MTRRHIVLMLTFLCGCCGFLSAQSDNDPSALKLKDRGRPSRRLSENSSVLPAPLMDLLLEVLFDLDSDLGAHRSS